MRPMASASGRRPSVDQEEAQALEAAAGLRSAGAKLVCIDFDATFVRVHTGGRWARSAAELRAHVRRFFLLLVPLLCEAGVSVAIVTFSPQTALIRDVLRLSFPAALAEQLVVRGDDRSWSLANAQAADFLPLWQADGRHLDRKFKLPFMISAALEVQRRRGAVVRNRDTVLVDDDAVNIRVANDSGVVGVFFDPQQADVEHFCRSIRKLQVQQQEQEQEQEQEPQPAPTPLRTPSKKPRSVAGGVKLVAKEHRFLTTGSGSGARRRLGIAPGSAGGGGRTSTFNMCTPSPVMKLKCSVDMGRPRSKRASRMMRNYRKEMEAALPVVAEAAASTFSVAEVPTTPTKPPAALSETREPQTSPVVHEM